jgi:hypothetical protein
MNDLDKKIRRMTCTQMFEALGVKTEPAHVKAWLNATAVMEIGLFIETVHSLIKSKDDGYQTVPQPGEAWTRARRLVMAKYPDECEYSPNQGQLPPRWFRDDERRQDRLTIEWQQKALPENAREFAALADHVLGAQK